MRNLYHRLDAAITRFLRRWSVTILRVAVAIVFIWFGLLKVLDITPVSDLVGRTVYWVDPGWFVPALGWVEVVVGVGLMFRIALRPVLALFVLQMIGTFLVLIVLPEVSFQDGNLFALTVEGEFVVKNLVLLAAGLVVGSEVDSDHAAASERS